MVALPSGILASSFSERMRQRRESMQTKIDQALEDGLITREEELSLRKLGRDLGLNEEAISASSRTLKQFSTKNNDNHK